MKKISTILKASVVAIAVFLSSGANAQIDIKTNLLGLAFNDYGVYGEYSISENMSAQLGLMYSVNKFGATSDLSSNDLNTKWAGFKVIPSFRFYFSPDDPTEGFFVEPYIRYKHQKRSGMTASIPVDDNGNYDQNWANDNNTKTQDRPYTTTRSKAGFGLSIGKKWVHDAGFVFETYIGFGKNGNTNVKYSDEDVQSYYNSILNFKSPLHVHARAGVSIGWRI